jgi:phage terminase small subunit
MAKDQQILFAEHYAVCLNGTKAAKLAGYKGDDNTLCATGSRLLRNDRVRARIDELLAQQAMSAQEILARLADHARGDMLQLLDPATMVLDTKKAEGKTHLIKSIEQTVITDNKSDKETIITKVEMYDAQSALVHLGKAAGLFTTKTDITSGGKPVQTISIVEVIKPPNLDE